MGLHLQPVAPRQGWSWIRRAFALWARRPLAFVGLFVLFLLAVLLLAVLLPVVGGVVGLAMLPMLTLGFMIASRSALNNGPVHALQLIEGLRRPDPRRRAQWLLCIAYALGSIVVITLADWVDDGLFVQLQRLISEPTPTAPAGEIAALLADPRLASGMLVRVGLAALLSVPFWFAPALVHWGHQGVLQAMFSSTVALWRARGAFVVYGLAWAGLMVGVAVFAMLVGMLTGSRQTLGLLAMPIGLVLSSVFYISLWFSFADAFGADPEIEPRPAGSTIL